MKWGRNLWLSAVLSLVKGAVMDSTDTTREMRSRPRQATPRAVQLEEITIILFLDDDDVPVFCLVCPVSRLGPLNLTH